MQTFLPYEDFSQSAKVLDRQRLGKQRVECLQILQTLKNGSRWSNHPAVKMWQGYESCLVLYGLAICNEWKQRGYKDTCYEKILAFMSKDSIDEGGIPFSPSFLGNAEFHSSHRSNLLRKNMEHYGKFNWKESPDLPYVWPTGLQNAKNIT